MLGLISSARHLFSFGGGYAKALARGSLTVVRYWAEERAQQAKACITQLCLRYFGAWGCLGGSAAEWLQRKGRNKQQLCNNRLCSEKNIKMPRCPLLTSSQFRLHKMVISISTGNSQTKPSIIHRAHWVMKTSSNTGISTENWHINCEEHISQF